MRKPNAHAHSLTRKRVIKVTLETGKNSYATTDEADAYVSAFYNASETANQWLALDNSAKQLRLVAACFEIETLPFAGRKQIVGQPLMFPRWPSDAVPDAVKYAQIEIALLEFDAEEQQRLQSAQKRLQLQKQGVTSFSLGDLSESYGGRAEAIVAQYPFLSNGRINRLLERYLQGGYPIC